MKLHKGLLLFGVSTLLLVACGDEDDTEESNAINEQEIEIVAEEVEAGEEDEEEEEEFEEVAADTSNEIILGEPMEIGEYTMTFQSYELGTDYEGKDALIINYDWINNSEDTASPFMTFILKGFQNGVETGDVFMVDGVDLGIGQSEVRPGGKIEGAQDIVAIDDMDTPLELELDELFSFENNEKLVVLDLSELQ